MVHNDSYFGFDDDNNFDGAWRHIESNSTNDKKEHCRICSTFNKSKDIVTVLLC